jgi:hypothetical protein
MKVISKGGATFVAFATVVAGVGVTTEAWGLSTSRSCTSGGGILNSTITYNTSATRHTWLIMYGKATGDAGDQNNFRGRITVNSQGVWSHNSADSYGDGEQWYKNVYNAAGNHLTTSRDADEKVFTRAYFDQFGGDPSCETLVDF